MYNEESERGQAVTPDHAPDHTLSSEENVATSKSTKFAAFQFYPRDFLTSDKVARMSLTEIGIYITLLSYSWLGHGLPENHAEIAKLVRIPLPRFKKIWAGVLSECFVLKGGKLVNPRQERQRKELQDYVASCQRGGERSAATRKERYGSAQPSKSLRSDAEVTPNTASALASPSSSASAEKDVRRTPLVVRRRMDAAWEGPKGLYVPQRKHSDFVQLRNHPGAERELWDWYSEVAEAWTGSPGADMLKFWTARFDEKWPAPAAATASTARRPAWAKP